MKVTYSWLKDFVDIRLKPAALAEKLTMAGLSVASLEAVDGDWVYDIEVTSNRPDWLSVRGIAREVAAITGGKLKKSRATSCEPRAKSSKNPKPEACSPKSFSLAIDDKKGCRLYCGNFITGVKVGPSPDGIKKRLEKVGIRSVNNVVDITNYCLMEYGQPLHAFDFDQIQDATIVVRRGRDKERVVLIDGSEKELNSNFLVIADSAKPVAIAGIMGLKDTEVSSRTTQILLESALFDPVVIRRGSRLLGVASDSSYRFERGVDGAVVKEALDAATAMICQWCGGALIASQHAGLAREPEARKVLLSLRDVRQDLALDLTTPEVKKILVSLGFSVKAKAEGRLEIGVPHFRRDVKIAEDLTEEIVRIYGYNAVPLTTPSIKPFVIDEPPTRAVTRKLKETLVLLGLKEVVTYSLISEGDYQKSALGVPGDAMSLENPLSQDYMLLRSSMIPSLLACVSLNANRNQKSLEIFEVGPVVISGGQKTSLGIALTGARRSSWQKESSAYTLFDIKGIVESVLEELAVKNFEFRPSREGFAEPGKACQVILKDRVIGLFGKVADDVKKAWGMKGKEDVFAAEISVEALADGADLKKFFTPFSSTPSIVRDISLVVPAQASYAKIQAVIQEHAGRYLKNIALVDCYYGKEIPQGSLGLTISVEYGSAEKTLTEEEVNPVHAKVLERLTQDLSVALR